MDSLTTPTYKALFLLFFNHTILCPSTMSSSTATNPIIDSEKWTEGDFTIVSADGVRFKAPSKVLLYHR